MCSKTKADIASGSPFCLAGLFLFVFIVLRQSFQVAYAVFQPFGEL